ncbi:hypothetical protein FOZ62_009400, partial [Perkinsus olseni]
VGDLLLSGADDGSFKVWDVRNTGHGPMANFKWHRDAVTSVDWHPYDETLLAVASADNTVSLWDMSVEADDDEAQGGQHLEGEEDYPAQMMFLHQGQTGVKEVKFHPQLPGARGCMDPLVVRYGMSEGLVIELMPAQTRLLLAACSNRLGRLRLSEGRRGRSTAILLGGSIGVMGWAAASDGGGGSRALCEEDT